MAMSERIFSYERMVFQWIHKLGIKVDVDDFAQVGRLAVYEGLQKSDGDSQLNEPSLVYGLIRNRMIDEIRRRSKFSAEVCVEDSVVPLVVASCDDAFYQEWMMVARENLNDLEFSCFEMLLAGYTQVEIASRIGKSRSSVKLYRKHIREKLAVYL